ncbi:PREDICTED: cystathionine gamma-lyase-like [Trachymyrmex cornetzi]|uniref:cystathionine gamma-lyase-like n=1 Tax=Trachymyrmex cornetzi TaxID=471704 RepID=UPI00084F06F0|nr:PREDICTED: cystathionine gamma-lyase-like [Trachymyrmex cornetzi]XP_018374928.1 PREDICTED: cystathionine gamma-lyase-like [Trachymyrmex cornetzi]XP_018374929.1 PREDICTED: cystathionine gamma-lyase-like [Trachymyrmex cornetzi]
MTSTKKGFATTAIHAGQDPDQWNHRSVVPPLVMSATFKQDDPAPTGEYLYGRSGNPTRNVLETCLAALENGKHAFCFSSGLGTLTAITGLLKAGDHLIVGDELYGGTNNHIRKCSSRQGMTSTFVDMTDKQNVINAIQPNTKMIWLETPTNPLLKLTDIKAVVESLKSRPDIILVVDNTFLTSYFQKPLDLGADIVMYSLTKYMNGHTDVIMGAAITRRDDLAQKLRFNQIVMGIVPSPFDCALVNRSLKTLELRMEKHMKNGLAVATFLDSHPNVEKVVHPLLSSHPQHQLALTQQTGHSGMVSFYLKGDSKRFLLALKVFILCGSLGGPESLAESPILISHEALPEDMRAKLGITNQLIRLSVGLETKDDLIVDLKQALDACQ